MRKIELSKTHEITFLSYCTSWENKCECCNTSSDKSVEFQMYLKGERNIHQNGKHLNLCHICALAFISHEEIPCNYIYGESVNISSTDKVKSLLITLIKSIRGL